VTAPQDPNDPFGAPPPAAPPPGGAVPPPQYGAPPPGYGPPPGYAAPRGTNTLAIISLIGAFICTPAGLICGIIALGQIKKTGEQGRGLALAGTIISGVFLVLSIVLVLALFAFGSSCSTDSYGYSSC